MLPLSPPSFLNKKGVFGLFKQKIFDGLDLGNIRLISKDFRAFRVLPFSIDITDL
jgi:hypothetical protein